MKEIKSATIESITLYIVSEKIINYYIPILVKIYKKKKKKKNEKRKV